MKYRIVLIVALQIAGSLSMLALFILTQPRDVKNGFVRAIPERSLQTVLRIDLKTSQSYFAGVTKQAVYLGNLKSPLEVTEVVGSRLRQRNIDPATFPIPKVSKVSIFPPYFFLADLIEYRIYRGTLKDWKLLHEVHASRRFFTEMVPVSPTSLVLRTFKTHKNEFTLGWENFETGAMKEETDLIKKQVDGIFCADGILQFDPSVSKVIYSYFSRNEFICTDSNLNIYYVGNTIDTTSRSKVKVKDIPTSNGYSLASPPNIINRRTSVYNNKLYVNSLLIADNEDRAKFKQVDVIDIYDLTDGRYLKSLYVEHFEDSKFRNFIVYEDSIYSLTGHVLNAYRIE